MKQTTDKIKKKCCKLAGKNYLICYYSQGNWVECWYENQFGKLSNRDSVNIETGEVIKKLRTIGKSTNPITIEYRSNQK